MRACFEHWGWYTDTSLRYLQVLHLWEPGRDGGEQVVVEVELSEALDVVQAAVLDTTDPVVAEAQPVRAQETHTYVVVQVCVL